MIKDEQLHEILGSEVRTADGEKVGRAGQIFLDDESGRPEWVTVQTGLFGTKESFVPLTQSDWTGDTLVVQYPKDTIKGAPNVDVDEGHLPQSEEDELYRYYGLDDHQAQALDVNGAGSRDTRDRTAPGTSGGTGDDAMTRSEERLTAGKEQVVTGRARLRKYVETEQQQITVPVTKEKVRLEREPITDANRGDATAGSDISEEEHEVTLTEERPIVTKETVPVERVKLTKDVEASEETVTEQVRKERIAAEGDVESDNTR